MMLTRILGLATTAEVAALGARIDRWIGLANEEARRQAALVREVRESLGVAVAELKAAGVALREVGVSLRQGQAELVAKRVRRVLRKQRR
jgi:hypothetical protein